MVQGTYGTLGGAAHPLHQAGLVITSSPRNSPCHHRLDLLRLGYAQHREPAYRPAAYWLAQLPAVGQVR